MNLQKFYISEYPNDDLGKNISNVATFLGLYETLVNCEDVYEYIGVYDSVIRERLFEQLAKFKNTNYHRIYLLWLLAE